VPYHLITKLTAQGLNSSLCNWVMDFLTGHPDMVKMGNSSKLILITGGPQGCVLSPLLYLIIYLFNLYLTREASWEQVLICNCNLAKIKQSSSTHTTELQME
jgi:hypothetical protein